MDPSTRYTRLNSGSDFGVTVSKVGQPQTETPVAAEAPGDTPPKKPNLQDKALKVTSGAAKVGKYIGVGLLGTALFVAGAPIAALGFFAVQFIPTSIAGSENGRKIFGIIQGHETDPSGKLGNVFELYVKGTDSLIKKLLSTKEKVADIETVDAESEEALNVTPENENLDEEVVINPTTPRSSISVSRSSTEEIEEDEEEEDEEGIDFSEGVSVRRASIDSDSSSVESDAEEDYEMSSQSSDISSPVSLDEGNEEEMVDLDSESIEDKR